VGTTEPVNGNISKSTVERCSIMSSIWRL